MATTTTLAERAGRLLELLEEADQEAVTLGELEVVGVVEPAQALLELELAGHTFERVYAMGSGERPLECVRLARGDAPVLPRPLQPVAPAAGLRRAPVRAARAPRPSVLATLALLLLGLVLVRALARRR